MATRALSRLSTGVATLPSWARTRLPEKPLPSRLRAVTKAGLAGIEVVFRLVLGPEHGHQQGHHRTQHAADGNEEIEEEQVQQQGRARTPVLRRGHLRDGQREQRRGHQVQRQVGGQHAQPVAALQQQGDGGGLETQTGSGEFKQHSVPPG
jgi:hypothetical protein